MSSPWRIPGTIGRRVSREVQGSKASNQGVLGGVAAPPAGAVLPLEEAKGLACSVSPPSSEETEQNKGDGGILDINSGLVSRCVESVESSETPVRTPADEAERPKTEPPQSAAKGEAAAKERATRQIRIRLPNWFCDQLETLKPTHRQDVLESFCACWKSKVDIQKLQDSTTQIRKIGINLNNVLKIIHDRQRPENAADLLRVILELREFCDQLGGRSNAS